MRAIVAFAAAVGFVASALSHCYALLGLPLFESKLLLISLHAGILVVSIISFTVFRRIAGRQRGFSDFALLPPWSLALMLVFFLYALVNFASSSPPDGTPDRHGETFVLTKKGGVVRALSYSEFRSAQAGLIRSFSGYWMFFYATGGLLMLARKERESA